MNITSIDELKLMSGGEIVELPPFVQGKQFVAKLRRPSMMNLVRQGKIPNSLIKMATDLFNGATKDSEASAEEAMPQMLQIMEIMAEATFIEPKWSDIKAAGIELTDEQMIFIFNYTQNGVQQVAPSPENTEDITNY